jgi:hypothetical protein
LLATPNTMPVFPSSSIGSPLRVQSSGFREFGSTTRNPEP